MVDTGTAPPTINSTLSGLKFFFDVTLGHGELMVKMQPVHQPRPLPVVLSGEEVARPIAAAPSAKYQAALSVAYGAGAASARHLAGMVLPSAPQHHRDTAIVTCALLVTIAAALSAG